MDVPFKQTNIRARVCVCVCMCARVHVGEAFMKI